MMSKVISYLDFKGDCMRQIFNLLLGTVLLISMSAYALDDASVTTLRVYPAKKIKLLIKMLCADAK